LRRFFSCFWRHREIILAFLKKKEIENKVSPIIFLVGGILLVFLFLSAKIKKPLSTCEFEGE